MEGLSRQFVFICLFVFSQFSFAFDSAENLARFIYQRLNGENLRAGTPVFNEMVTRIRAGQLREAGNLATLEAGFVGATARHWGASLLTKGTNPQLELNDSLALVIGAVRDNLDVRLILTGNFTYGADPRLNYGRPSTDSNSLYIRLDSQYQELQKLLFAYFPQWNSSPEVSGVFTTRAWAADNYSAGTNRRAVVNAFESFLCLPIDSWKRPNLPTTRIRQDIDRFPQGDARVFQTECRTCHSAMDGFAGAFAQIDFRLNRLEWDSYVNPKYLAHSEVYPDGFVTSGRSWINYLQDDPQNIFGWDSSPEGNGILEFGIMIANSRLFSECMVKRVLETVCRSNLQVNSPFVREFATQFRNQGYRLKDLFIDVAIHPTCQDLVLSAMAREGDGPDDILERN